MKQLVIRLPSAAALLACALFYASAVQAEGTNTSLVPPTDPTQSITYWKKYTLNDDSELVKQSQQVFTVLLRAWDQSRIEPGLYVVESDSGAWAASLADGNILLSKQAIETCFSFGKQRGEHLLAFVLAHELAHQRADDLWHQRFFRMIGTQSAESQKKMLAGLELDAGLLTQLEQKEAQADHDGLVLMSSVGFDAYQIINDKDFFTLWVENIWQQNCAANNTAKSNHDACKQAQARALRTQTQLETVATQSMLYELGLQAFVAGNYQQAREYFTIYGRDYPGRAIISAIGLSYFAQAQAIQKQLAELAVAEGSKQQADFYYPMILDAHANGAAAAQSSNSKRADLKGLTSRLQKQKLTLVNQSISQFEKAIRLAPDYQQTYLLLASAHLLTNNSYRVRGVLQGQYVPMFGKDSVVEMLLALTDAIEGNSDLSIKKLKALVKTLNANTAVSPIAENILRYSVFYNLAELYETIDKAEEAKKVWLDLAQLSKKKGDTLLFRLALTHISQNKQPVITQKLQEAPAINGHRLGDTVHLTKTLDRSDLWIDGDRYQIVLDNGSRYITDIKGALISAWQTDSNSKKSHINNKLHIGDPADRPFKILGIPDRRLNMTSGEYLAYDDYGLALRISNDQVKGWFLYDN
ncbi:MAG: hypothetical protein IMF15_04460 [Proteobacteria bacterium]|nr:hypothetical protein [Pseudomonadota bacterium]